jgi:fucose permease
VIASLSAGPVIDKRGNKPALVLGLLLVSVAAFTTPTAANSFVALMVAYFVLGIGGGIVVTGANSLVGAVEPTRRGSALNFLNLFFGLGGIITTYAASNIFTPVTLCYSIATLTVVALAVNAATKMPGPSGSSGFQASDVPALLANPALILLSLFLFLYVACEVGVWNWLNTFLRDSRGFAPASAGSVVSYGFAFGILVGRLVISRVLVKVPALTVTLFSAVLIAITTFIMLRLPGRTGITIAVFCAGLSMAPVFPTILAVVGDTFRRGTATAMGIAITCGWIGLVVSSPIIGFFQERSSLGNALLLIPAFGVIMVVVNLVLRGVLQKRVTA